MFLTSDELVSREYKSHAVKPNKLACVDSSCLVCAQCDENYVADETGTF